MLSDKRALGFKDVLIIPQASDIRSRKEVSLERTFKFRNGQELTCVPIIAANMANIGTFKVAQVLSKYKMLACIVKSMPLDAFINNAMYNPEPWPYIVPTFGLSEGAYITVFQHHFPTDMICLDVANGYMKDFINYVTDIKDQFPDKVIIAGNVATAEGAERLYEAGADIVKVGIGSGSVCTTRYKTGIGVPQITAIDDCEKMAAYYDGCIYTCSDGGCTGPGDVAKAFVAGADFVMLGGLLAGTRETGNIYQGSAHLTDWDGGYKTSEGKRVNLQEPVQSLDERLQDILGGIRSTGSYIGQRRIEDFNKADLIQVQEQTNDIFGRPS